ncbi:transporter [Actinobacillus equuli subsp. haemolyticus]|uniref:transporter n=1 Tax=Actinobacillus equuli TaxID=718 RepID=UPI00244119EE|nr:transporter [Actinobacillus equuli]WGE56747.1 transporter [Actinobacillus equuli subsp. equuli]WGE67368.1 transporter [Actinobacillus equuli subsp. haemolyticus]WGE81151.1 transporter [Actinobacillus equuli subsp. haemolyticus]
MQQQQSISLSAFFKRLCKGTTTLIFTTAIGAGAAFGLAQLQTPVWKSVAQFDQPRVLELGNYYALYSTYSFLNGGDNVTYHVLKDDKSALSLAPAVSQKAEELAAQAAYEEFKRNLTSVDVLVNFLAQTETVKLKAQLENKPIAVVAQQMATQFVFDNASKRQPADRLSVSSANPEEAQQLLSQFIAFANQQTKQTLNAELIAKWKILFQQVKTAAEIKLGATQQGNQIAAQDWNGKLALMRSVQPLDDKLVAFRFVKAPNVPLSPHSPNQSLWLMIGGLSGLLFGIMLVSFSGLLSRKQGNGETN